MILGIVQARCTSSRLPGKVLRTILGVPMILHQLNRLQKSKNIAKIVLATSWDKSDDDLVSLVNNYGVDVFRGSLNDVLDRYYQCAKQYNANVVVRMTGDCPVIDWRIIDAVITKHLKENNDYTSNTVDPTYPDGLDVEVMTFNALAKAWKEGRLPSEREHVTPYIINNAEIFKIGNLLNSRNLSYMRWTVDELNDFKFITKIYENLYYQKEDFDMGDIVRLLEQKPDIALINSGIVRNEGLLKSLGKDRNLMREKINNGSDK